MEEDKNYFQLYPSVNTEKPYLFYVENLKGQFSIVNTTDGENMIIVENSTKTDEIPIKHLSSVIQYNDTFTIKTCFGPNKIVEIIDEENQVLTPNDDYFKNVKNNLENIKYCYSTSIANPYLLSEFTIVTYWTEFKIQNGKEIYTHKSILFIPRTKTFSKIYTLDTKGDNFYAQDCTNIGNKYIYCNMDSSVELSNKYHFSIIPDYVNANEIKMLIRLVTVFARISNAIYHKPIGTFKYFYSKTGKYAYYFLTEYHDEKSKKTRLMTSLYVNHDLYSFILRFENNLEVYHGINIEDTFLRFILIQIYLIICYQIRMN